MKKFPNAFDYAFVVALAILTFTLIGVGIGQRLKPPTLKYRPKPPSCCGDSICLMERHHG